MKLSAHLVRFGVLAIMLAVIAVCLVRTRDRWPSSQGETEPDTPSAPQRAALELPPAPALPQARLAGSPFDSDVDLPGTALTSVWWTIQPTGAVLHVQGMHLDIVATADTSRVETRLPMGFYTVEVSAEGYETWRRRTPLGGTSTNQAVTLFLLPPKPLPSPAEVASSATTPVPYFPQRTNLRKLALDEPSATIAETPSQTVPELPEPSFPKVTVPTAAPSLPVPSAEPVAAVDIPSPAVEIATATLAPPIPAADSVAAANTPAHDSVVLATEPIAITLPAPTTEQPPAPLPVAIPDIETFLDIQPEPTPVPVPAPAEMPATVAAPAPVPEPPPVPESVPAPAETAATAAAPAPVPEPVPTQESVPTPAVVAAPSPVPVPVPEPALTPAIVPAPISAPVAEGADTSAPSPAQTAGASESILRPTTLVRGVLESTVEGDEFLFSAPKTLSIGNDVMALHEMSFAYDYTGAPRLPVGVQVRGYIVSGPVTPPAFSPNGVATVFFRATPNPATARFPYLDTLARLRTSGGLPLATYDPATRTLRDIPALSPAAFVLSRRAHLVQPVTLPPMNPATQTDFDLRSAPLPVYGSAGEVRSIDLGDGISLPVVWIPAGEVPVPGSPGSVWTVPRGFWLSRGTVSRGQLRAVFPDAPATGPGDPAPAVTSATGFQDFARPLTAAEPRLVVRLPSRAELLRAAAAGERGIQPHRELVSDGTAATGPFHAVLVMLLPNPAQP